MILLPWSTSPVDLTSTDYLYRFESRRVGEGYVDEFGDYHSTGSHTELHLHRYRITKRTPKGFWLDNRFVLASGRKRFAYPTVEEAKVSFFRRKELQIAYKQAEIRAAQEAVAMVNSNKWRVI